MKPAHLVFLMLVNLGWGLNIVPLKLGLGIFPPITLSLLRFIMVFILCSPAFKWLSGKMMQILIVGIVIGPLQFALMNVSFSLAHNVSALAIASQLGVPFSLMLAMVFLGERIRWLRVVGIVLAFSGVALLSFDPKIFDERLALILVIAATFSGSVGAILMRRLHGVPALTLQAWVATISLLPLLLLSLVFEPGALAALPQAPLYGFGYILFSAAIGSVVGHAGMAYLLQRYPVTVVSPFTLLAPLLSVLFSVWLLDNHLSLRMIIGGLITLIGVAIITFRAAQREVKEASV